MASGAPHDVDSHDLVGRTIDKYKLTRLIGVGGMGRVYEGIHTTLGKKFALKFIDRESATPEAIQRFQREAQAASAVESAHIVDIFDVGTSQDGEPFLVMELLRGEDLGHRIRRLGRLDVPEALRVTAHVLRGLARAHEAGIVHRDLKPDNVFLVERDDDPCFAKVLDFGVSKIHKPNVATKTITREGVVLGTPVYMSPEQAQAMPDVDHRSDLWSVGAILYECLAGSPPFSGPTYEAVIVGICTRDADDVRLRNPEVPESIASFLRRALCRERAQRFANAREMLDALVAESAGLLPSSMKSDSLRKAVFRPPPTPGSKEGMTLAAVSTVAATPAASASGSAAEIVARHPRTYLAVGAAAVAVGGIVAGIWYANAATKPGSETGQRQVIVVQSPGATTTVVVSAEVLATAPAAPSVEAKPSASAQEPPPASASATPSASAAPKLVLRKRPAAPTSAAVAGSSATVDAPPKGVGSDLKIKPQ
jgi:serine/threonine protein kinase